MGIKGLRKYLTQHNIRGYQDEDIPKGSTLLVDASGFLFHCIKIADSRRIIAKQLGLTLSVCYKWSTVGFVDR